MKYPIVKVDWKDIKSDSAWQSVEEAQGSQPIIVQTVGYLLKIDKKEKRMILGHSITENGDVDHTVIPLGVVVKVRWMRTGKEFSESKWQV